MPNQRNRYPARRRFLKQSAALTASASLAAPAAVLAAPAVHLHLEGGDAAAAALARRLGADLARALRRPVRVIEGPVATDHAAAVLRLQPQAVHDAASADMTALATLQAGACRLALLAEAGVSPAVTAAAVAAARALRA